MSVNFDGIHRDYYWEFAVLSQSNTATAFLAQLDELSYLPQSVDFQMLLSDQTLNILTYFKVDDEGIPQWEMERNKGDLQQMANDWILKNRDSELLNGIVKKTKKKTKKRTKSKRHRTVNSMRTTFEQEEEEERQREDLDVSVIDPAERERERERERAERRRRKKEKKKKREKKKKKKKKEKDRKIDAQSVL